MSEKEIAALASAAKTGTRKIEITEELSNAANNIVYDDDSTTLSPPITVICGPRNCGKSTFSRLLLNTLLLRYKRVAYLDTDVGQPEFTPPGCLSLTIVDQANPDYTIPDLKIPKRFHFFGDVSPKRDPEGYLNCVFSLHDHYKREQQCSSRKNKISGDVPLIVNTCGWVKGVGYELLVDMLRHIAPTHVVKIGFSSEDSSPKVRSISDEDMNLPGGQFWSDVSDAVPVNLLEITSASKVCGGRKSFQKRANLIRDLRLRSYFMQCFPGDDQKTLARALASHTPYQVPISRITIRHLHCKVPITEVYYSLNATMIGLAASTGDPQSFPVCVGLGIVRGIDISKNLLYVITPVPQSVLASVDLILQGLIQIPVSLLQVKGYVSPYMSTNVLSDEQFPKTEKKRKKRKSVFADNEQMNSV